MFLNDTVDYAWTITTDLIDDGDSLGVSGPSQASEEILEAVQGIVPLEASLERYTFRMYDGDGELYYRGTLLVYAGSKNFDEAISAPLDNYGGPNAGCAFIMYDGHPEFDCEW